MAPVISDEWRQYEAYEEEFLQERRRADGFGPPFHAKSHKEALLDPTTPTQELKDRVLSVVMEL